jgi:hypothetical protein
MSETRKLAAILGLSDIPRLAGDESITPPRTIARLTDRQEQQTKRTLCSSIPAFP